MASPVLTPEEAARLLPRRDFAPVHAYLAQEAAGLAAALGRWLPGFTRWEPRQNPENFGLYLRRMHAPAPFFWFGLGWRAGDGPEALPQWGASLEVNLEWVAPFEAGVGGLREAFEAAARASHGAIGLHRFEAHVELAEWRPLEWLLAEADQRGELGRFWASYLEHLAAHGVLPAVEAFLGEVATPRGSGP